MVDLFSLLIIYELRKSFFKNCLKIFHSVQYLCNSLLLGGFSLFAFFCIFFLYIFESEKFLFTRQNSHFHFSFACFSLFVVFLLWLFQYFIGVGVYVLLITVSGRRMIFINTST